jgi:hypothetical protein
MAYIPSEPQSLRLSQPQRVTKHISSWPVWYQKATTPLGLPLVLNRDNQVSIIKEHLSEVNCKGLEGVTIKYQHQDQKRGQRRNGSARSWVRKGLRIVPNMM